MIARVKSLYLALLNVHYGFSYGKHHYLKKKEHIWEPIVLTLALLPAVVLLIWFFWSFTEQLFIAGLAFGQPHLSLVYGSLLAFVVTIFFGFFYVLATFYLSTDVEILVPLPLKPWEILVAKLGVVLTGQYVINGLLLLPIWLRYGLLADLGLAYVLSAVLAFILLPIVPLVLASVAAILLMRCTSLSQHRDRLTLLGGILLIILVVGFQLWLQNSLGGENPEILLEELLNQTDGLVKAIARFAPPALWVAQALAYSSTLSGWLNLVYLFSASLIGVALLYLLGERVFLQSIIGGLAGSKKLKTKSVDYLQVRKGSSFWSLVGTEIKLFVRDPGFALNGLVSYVFLPVLAVLPLFMKNVENNPFSLLTQSTWPDLLLIGGVALFYLAMTSMSMIPSTTFSREGKYLWIIRTLPLAIQDVIYPRVVAAQIVNTIGCLVGLIPLAILFKWGIVPVVVGSLFGIFLAAALSFSLILLDLSRPMLDWVNPIKAVKSNLNAMVGLFAAMVVVALMGSLFFLNFQTNTLWLIPLELGLIFMVLCIANFWIYKKYASELWHKLEGGIQ